MFYGALETKLIDKQRLTAIAETSHLFRNSGEDCTKGEYYTASRWETQNEFLIVEVVFSDLALENNPEVIQSFDNQKKLLQEHNLGEKDKTFHLEFLKFISNEFSKRVLNHEDYKITAAHLNIVLFYPNVEIRTRQITLNGNE